MYGNRNLHTRSVPIDVDGGLEGDEGVVDSAINLWYDKRSRSDDSVIQQLKTSLLYHDKAERTRVSCRSEPRSNSVTPDESFENSSSLQYRYFGLIGHDRKARMCDRKEM